MIVPNNVTDVVNMSLLPDQSRNDLLTIINHHLQRNPTTIMNMKSNRTQLALRRIFLATLLLTAAANSAYAQTTYFWDADGDGSSSTGGAGTWDTSSLLWRNGSDVGALAQWPNTDPSTDYAQFAGTAGTVTLNPASVDLRVNRIIFGITGYEIAAPTAGTAALVLSGTSPQVNTGTSVAATISARISGATGLTKTGDGTLTLSGANTYSGTTSVNAGRITVAGNHAGATGGWTVGVNSSATPLTFAAGSNISIGAGNHFTTVNGNGTANTQRVMSVSGSVTTSTTSNVTILGRNTLTISSGGSWDMQGGTLTIRPNNTNFSSVLNVNSGASFTYSGSNTIIVAKATTGNNGSGTLNLSGGTFTTSRGFSNSGAGSGGGTSNFNFSGGGTLKISNNIASIFTQASQPFNISMGVGGGVIDTNGFSTATSVAITGAGALTKAGDGVLTLSGANTYDGGTTVSGGTLNFQTTTAKPNAGTHSFAAGTTLGLGVAGVDAFLEADVTNAFAGTMTGNLSNVTVDATTNIGLDTTNGDFTYTVGIAGNPTRGLTKLGVNTLTMNGGLTYTGDTTVIGGTLALGSANASNDASTVTIASTAAVQLAYSGTDTIDKLFIGTEAQPAGVYGHSSTGATNGGKGVGVLDAWFASGTGTLTVASGPVLSPFELYMGGYPGLTGANALPETDADGDGLSNLAEFIMGGTAPNDGSLANRPVEETIGGHLTISLLVPNGATFTGSPSPSATVQGVQVSVGGSLDLLTFDRGVEATTLNPSLPSAPTGYQWHTFRLTDPIASQPRGFLRGIFTLP